MQRVTKFMKRSAHFVVGEQTWLPCRRLRDVEMVRHHWLETEQSALLDVLVHPRPATFGWPRVIVAEK